MRDETPVRFQTGAVCGRFQPLHLEHLDYIKRAKERCDFLWVGIVNPDIRALIPCPDDHHRGESASNPLTYFERVQIIVQALLEIGWSRSDFGCTPFPLDMKDRVADFLPTSIPIFISICDDWSNTKSLLLQNMGYNTEIVVTRDKTRITGTRIRAMIAENDDQWQHLVPAATRRVLANLSLRKRIAEGGL